MNFKKEFLLLLLLPFLACRPKGLTDAEKENLLNKGDSIATIAQKIFMTSVLNEVKTKGAAEAVSYCNINASHLMDSTSVLMHTEVKRLSDRSRNPENSLKTDNDFTVWIDLKDILNDPKFEKKHLIDEEQGGAVYYYKAITIGMPTCLACHGKIGSDINEATAAKIASLYPEDKATGYEMGQLRGMWKIKLR